MSDPQQGPSKSPSKKGDDKDTKKLPSIEDEDPSKQCPICGEADDGHDHNVVIQEHENSAAGDSLVSSTTAGTPSPMGSIPKTPSPTPTCPSEEEGEGVDWNPRLTDPLNINDTVPQAQAPHQRSLYERITNDVPATVSTLFNAFSTSKNVTGGDGGELEIPPDPLPVRPKTPNPIRSKRDTGSDLPGPVKPKRKFETDLSVTPKPAETVTTTDVGTGEASSEVGSSSGIAAQIPPALPSTDDEKRDAEAQPKRIKIVKPPREHSIQDEAKQGKGAAGGLGVIPEEPSPNNSALTAEPSVVPWTSIPDEEPSTSAAALAKDAAAAASQVKIPMGLSDFHFHQVEILHVDIGDVESVAGREKAVGKQTTGAGGEAPAEGETAGGGETGAGGETEAGGETANKFQRAWSMASSMLSRLPSLGALNSFLGGNPSSPSGPNERTPLIPPTPSALNTENQSGFRAVMKMLYDNLPENSTVKTIAKVTTLVAGGSAGAVCVGIYASGQPVGPTLQKWAKTAFKWVAHWGSGGDHHDDDDNDEGHGNATSTVSPSIFPFSEVTENILMPNVTTDAIVHLTRSGRDYFYPY